MEINFNTPKIIQKFTEKITSINTNEDSINNIGLTSNQEAKNENELLSVDLIKTLTFKDNSIAEDEIIDYIEQLDEAIENPGKKSKRTIKTILMESNLNSSDILSIMASYPGEKDWLVQGIKKQFSGKEEDALLKTISYACARMTNSDDKLANGIARSYVKSIDDLSKFYIPADNIDPNIRISSMITGIRG